MAAQTPPFVLATGSHSAALFREAVSSLLNPAGGVIALGDLLVTQNGTPNMTVNVAAGEIWVPGTSAVNAEDAPQGQYFCYNDATVSLAISAANATNPRIDKVCATVDDAFYTGAANDWKLQVVTGTPTAGATLSNLNGAAATPANSVVIAYVLVPANTTTIVTADLLDNRVFAAPNLPMRGNPAGIAYAASGSAVSSALTAVTLSATLALKGGMTFTSLSGSGLVVPIAGLYHADGEVKVTNGASTTLAAAIGKNNVGVISGSQGATAAAAFQGAVASGLVSCAAGDVLNLMYQVSTTTPLQFDGTGVSVFLAAHLVSI